MPKTPVENDYDPEIASFAMQDEIRATLAMSCASSKTTALNIPMMPYGPRHDALTKLLAEGAVIKTDYGLYLASDDSSAKSMAKAIALSRFLLGFKPLPDDDGEVLLRTVGERQAAMLLFLYFVDSSTWIERAHSIIGGRYDDDVARMVADLEAKKLITDLWNRPSSPCHEISLKGRAVVESWLFGQQKRASGPFADISRRSGDPRQEPAALALRGRLPFELLGQHELEELCADYARRHLRLVGVHVVGSGSQEGRDVQGWIDDDHTQSVVLQAKSTDIRTLAKASVTKELKEHGSKIASTSRYYFVTNGRLDAASQKLVTAAGAQVGVPATPVARAELEDFLTRPSNYDLLPRYFPSLQLADNRRRSFPRKNLSDTNRWYRVRQLAQAALADREWGRELVVRDLEAAALRGIEEPWGTTEWEKQFARAGDTALEVVVAEKVIFRLPYDNVVFFDDADDSVYIVCPEQVRGLLGAGKGESDS